jgi:protein-S-isoprenylcysteine O-methyltransferase Ste14
VGFELVFRAPGEASSWHTDHRDRGSIAVWVGAAVAFHNWLAAVIVAPLMFTASSWRIHAEERMLRNAFGQGFSDYSARTSRIFPGLY